MLEDIRVQYTDLVLESQMVKQQLELFRGQVKERD
jgi:hypothetical protein